MPPKKEKKEPGVTGEQAQEIILDYLIQQNRPYSVIEVNANLHNAVSKANATKILKELHEAGKIEGRASGKQVVYHAIQDPAAGATEEELKALDAEAEEIRNQINTIKSKFKGQQSTGLSSIPSAESLRESISMTEAEINGLESKLAVLRVGTEQPTDKEKDQKVATEHAMVEKVHSLRKRQFKDLWNTITENYDGNRTELWENLNLDGEL